MAPLVSLWSSNLSQVKSLFANGSHLLFVACFVCSFARIANVSLLSILLLAKALHYRFLALLLSFVPSLATTYHYIVSCVVAVSLTSAMPHSWMLLLCCAEIVRSLANAIRAHKRMSPFACCLLRLLTLRRHLFFHYQQQCCLLATTSLKAPCVGQLIVMVSCMWSASFYFLIFQLTYISFCFIVRSLAGAVIARKRIAPFASWLLRSLALRRNFFSVARFLAHANHNACSLSRWLRCLWRRTYLFRRLQLRLYFFVCLLHASF